MAYRFRQGMKVLTIGDGDFSFSLALARIMCKGSNEEGSEVVATSYESLETLKKVYPSIQETIDEMLQLNVKIYYEVDATNLNDTLSLKSGNYHRIVWNFPCTAIANGQDGQNEQMKENQMLVKKFVKQCVHYLHPSGEIQFKHKTKPPYDQWGLERVAVEEDGVWSEKDPCPLEYKGRVVFDKCLLPPYTPRKALNKKSFPYHDACLFVFGWKTQKDTDENGSGKSYPSTIPVEDEAQDETEKDIMPVSNAMIDEIRNLHLMFGSYQDRKHRKLRK